MKRAAVLLVALSALLAGCGGSGGQTTSPGPATVSPGGSSPGGSSPQSTATVTPPDGPQGISDTSVNETKLLRGHVAAVQPQGYRLTINRSGRTNDSFRQWTSAGKLPLQIYIEKPSATARQYYVRTSAVGMDRTGVMNYANTTAGGGQYVVQLIPGGLGPTPADRRLAGYLRSIDLEPAGTRTVDGRTYRVLTTTMTEDDISSVNTTGALPSDLSEATALEATVLVDERGFIRSIDATYEYPDGTTNLTMYTDQVGSTTVEEPAWFCEARAQTNFQDDC